MNLEALKIDKRPTVFVAEMEKPNWDNFFMGLAFYYCTRSPDAQTKAGCVIVDWPSKIVIGLGYNGHPRGMNGLPTMREGSVLGDFVSITNGQGDRVVKYYKGEVVPKELRQHCDPNLLQGADDKYSLMCHADLNAIVNCVTPSTNAVGYIPFEPCENCFLAWLAKASPKVDFKRIVLLTSRPMTNTRKLLERRPDIRVDVLAPSLLADRNLPFPLSSPANDPALALLQSAQYCNLMIEQSAELSKDSAAVYRK